ncbi:MAG: hypothetical protein VCB59_11390 [Gammaproteobacteria bacterium]
MWQLILYFGMVGFAPPGSDGLAAAPFDVAGGPQVVDLREPLIARTEGARLVLFVRDRSELGLSKSEAIRDFEAAAPPGSIDAQLTGKDGEYLALAHSEYSFFRGYLGLVLTQVGDAERTSRYQHLEFDSKIPLKGVRLVWLDRQGRRVQDVRPSL